MLNQQLMVKASWFYHVEGLTQAQIADRMLLTRRRVNELLAAALQQGIVRVSFNSPLADSVEMEAELCRRHGLTDVVIVPTPNDKAQMPLVLGRAAAMFLDQMVHAGKVQSLGVGWGATLRETAHQLTPTNSADIKVHSMMGGLTRGSEVNTFEIVRRFAKRLNAECHYLAAPIYADDPASRDTIIAQSVFAALLRDAVDVNVCLLSVGDVTQESLQVRYGLPTRTEISELVGAGAVGDLLGRYLDQDGCEIDHPLNRQVISPELEEYRNIPCRIIASGGFNKRQIIRACLANDLVDVLVTDSETASWLLM
ncbi:sugar-binding transcriptional regulator [Rhizobium lusitanum]|uniref:DNA-binding transcriptional regulator LsrR (DeoR family) n=1 Tax=Rhizobium lusitanum TaxID=293958 RepID=A0A7X0IZ71_9HYPH|nr:sugar-binding transcriptional regulator [Rhizobium lusitanum]MBB6489509.1 DNA-binding transcriptional regulator LsrR (DeoR family) [Rhizobium lusitanum]